MSVCRNVRADDLSVTTFHYDNQRTGWNSRETVLTPANVASATFGRLWSTHLDGDVCGSPLYVAGVTINGVSRDIVYAATNANTVYALDALTGRILWGPVRVARPISDVAFTGSGDLKRPNGILSTPVIDLAHSRIYVCALSQPGISQIYQVWAIDITTGHIERGWPVLVHGSFLGCLFDAGQIDQRGALLLDNDGWLYIPFGARFDRPDWHGWIVGIDTNHPSAPERLWSPDPYDDGGGIWGVGGLSADSAGRLFAVIGNGANTFATGGKELGQSIVRLEPTPHGLSIHYNASDCYVPSNVAYLNETDEDLGGGGAALITAHGDPSHRSLLITGGKEGVVYVVDQAHLGGLSGELYKKRYFGDPNTPDLGEIRAAPAYFDAGAAGQIVYVPGEDPGPDGEKGLVALQLSFGDSSQIQVAQIWTLSQALARPGSPAVSSNGAQDGIVWITEPDLSDENGPPMGELHAYDALRGKELYNTEQAPQRDRLVHSRKFSAPVIVNGWVYVGVDGIDAYGLLPALKKVAQ